MRKAILLSALLLSCMLCACSGASQGADSSGENSVQIENSSDNSQNASTSTSNETSTDVDDESSEEENAVVLLDEELSAAATKYMDEGFGHAYGNPTSWYDYIDNIFIYSTPNDNYTATIFVSPDCQDADRIGNALMMNFDDVTIDYVMVVDDSGNILFERNNPLLE